MPYCGVYELATMTKEITTVKDCSGNAKTASKIAKRECLPALTEFARHMPAEKGEAFLRHALRCFEPWPDWVLKMIVEILRVYLPTIPKSTINDAVRFGHFFVFTADTDCFTEQKLNCSIEENLIRIPEVGIHHFGAVFGHLMALAENHSSLLKAAYEKKEISLEDFKAYGGGVSLETLQIQIQPHISSFINAVPAKLLEIIEGVVNAKQNTFDKNGVLQETTLTKIYGQMVRKWPTIEELSGPTELCVFLNPGLTKDDLCYDNRLDRVKKICRRMGVKFKPFKERGTPPPPPSVPTGESLAVVLWCP